jgi:PPOX class probable FMN-dependent enzyme
LSDPYAITSESQLRALYAQPGRLPAAAKADRLDALCRRFIALSPLVCISSCDAQGRQDVSPRGDPPGFVQVLDDRNVAIPDRPGNNKLETLSNIIANPNVALLFAIPGHDETLRLFGKARISCDPQLLALSIVAEKQPKTVIVVNIELVYPHCGKSFRRAKLWESGGHVERAKVPSLAEIGLTMAGEKDPPAAQVDQQIQQSYVSGLY